MIRNKVGMVFIFSMIFSNYAFALEESKVCNYPKHIKIDGPPSTVILWLNTWVTNDVISVVKTSETSFDVINKLGCQKEGARYIQLKVGTNAGHRSFHYFRTESEGDSELQDIPIDYDKGLKLSTVDKLSDTDYKLTYTYKHKV